MLLDMQGDGRFYHLDPQKHLEVMEKQSKKAEFSKAVHLTFKNSAIASQPADKIASLFSDYGDFFLFKDSENSVFLEFFELNPALVPDKELSTFIRLVTQTPNLNVEKACLH